MRIALELALESIRSGGGPFGAVVVRGERVVGQGMNRVVPYGDPTAHAEVLAIRDAAAALGTHDLGGCEIYASCEPCPMCLGAILWARLGRLHAAARSADAAAAGFDDGRFHAELAGRAGSVLAREEDGRLEGQAVFRTWLGQPDRRTY
jgi:tRNA(Arg) A34 adenosine deaminase TadA